MAKAIAKCTCATCGAKFEKTATRPNRAQANSWAEWAADHFDLCPDCYKAGQEEKDRQCAEQAKEQGLPELHGSPKQIAWAESIRIKKLADVTKLIEQTRARAKNATPEQNEALDATYSFAQARDSASWWIDKRDWSAFLIFRQCLKEAGVKVNA